MNPDIEAHLDNVFEQHAREVKDYYSTKNWHYSLENGKEGECKVLDVVYSKDLDCNVFTVEDIDTGETHKADQFSIDLTFI